MTDLESYKSVDLWLTELAHEKTGSPSTRHSCLFVLGRFCDDVGKDPDELVKMGKRDVQAVEQLVAKYFVKLEQEKGLSRNTCVTYYSWLRSFFRHNGIIFVKKTPQTWVAKRSRPLPKEDLRALMEFAPPRLKAFMAVMKDSGLAPVDVAALRCGDVDLTKAPPIPLQLMRRKTRIEFTTFVGPDAVNYLKRYLAMREKGTRRIPSEKITPKSPLFRAQTRDVRPATPGQIVVEFEKTRARAGVQARLYDLRKFFNTQLRLAHVSDDIIEYWMGHTLIGPRSAYLVPTVQEQAAEYARAYSRLALAESEALVAVKDAWKEQLVATLRLNPLFTPGQIEIVRKELDKFRDLSDVDWEAMRALVERVK